MPNPYSQSVFEPAVYQAVREYSLRSDPIPNAHLTNLYQANVETKNYNLNMNSPQIKPSKVNPYIKA
jgi:hypothetical protein